MSKKTANDPRPAAEEVEKKTTSRSYEIAKAGIRTTGDMAQYCTAMIVDIMEGAVDDGVPEKTLKWCKQTMAVASHRHKVNMSAVGVMQQDVSII
ncbi:MAG: hypothetical protein E6Q97_35615 [Desulfurellales bacterium]|nr:MAG: hypothetical protein E6Q97_35615 [Desulfurellales bacterium]